MRMKKLIHTNNMKFKECNMVKPPKKVTLRRGESKERQKKSHRDKRRK